MSNELNPCPFCGCKEIAVNQPTTIGSINTAYCTYCGAESYLGRWNARPVEDDLLATLATLKADNRQLVEQMNAMAVKYESLEQHCTALEEDINMWQASGAMPKEEK